MRFIFTLLLVCSMSAVCAQNLVLNPSFEKYIYCPGDLSQISNAAPWTDARKGIMNSSGIYLTGGSTDLFNQCAAGSGIGVPENFVGINNPRTGKGYAGMYVFHHREASNIPLSFVSREYMQGQFSEPLEAGKKYLVNFYVKAAHKTDTWYYINIAIENLGAYLSVPPTYQTDYPYLYGDVMQDIGHIPLEPQIVNPPGRFITPATGWTEIKGVYTAKGGEKYITLGNFKDNYNTNYIFLSPRRTDSNSHAYYMVDDVSVISCDKLINLGPDTTLCEGEKLLLNAYSTVSNFSYRWQDGSDKIYYEITKPGTYWVEAISEQNCITRDTLIVKATEQINLGTDTTLCPLQTYTLHASLGNGPYIWSDGSTEPTLEVTQAGTYWVKTYNSKGCEIGDTVTISFNSSDCLYDIPNVITPNGDGKNDTFVIKGIENEPIEIEIINRLGKKIYYNADYKNQWGNSNLSAGLYYYRIINRKSKRTHSGWIQVLY